jgi:hypothetical protein
LPSWGAKGDLCGAESGSYVATVLLFGCSVELQQVMLEPPTGSDASPEDLFSVVLPDEWEVTNPQAGGDSWTGTLFGDGFTISFLGGPFAISDIYRTLPGGGDSLLESKHINFGDEVNGHTAKIVQSRNPTEEGVTGMVLDLSSRTIVFTAIGLSQEEQDVAIDIFKSIQ